eukprot:TRINITY_DN57461_c0_g1_i1.p1 TRINITY_DN57461_c0_g1~~TRINITY_DN57461_c0_g1_i1.p1  ORF type:complete len:351 (-),score=25.54 TRINITY_DN57461_c0_g1_i1:40-1092(-)
MTVKHKVVNDNVKKTASNTFAPPPVLPSTSALPKYEMESVNQESSKHAASDKGVAQYVKDAQEMKPATLKKKYELTYVSWRNMKQRVKKGFTVCKEFETFSGFLSHVGPRTEAKYTLDRLDNSDLEYGVGKVGWRDKTEQNSNKGNNVYLTDDNGDKRTVAEWAKLTDQSPSTIYSRLKKGWSDHEAIHGQGTGTSAAATLWKDTPWPVGREKIWEYEYQASQNDFNKTTRAEFYWIRLNKLIKDHAKLLEGFKGRLIDEQEEDMIVDHDTGERVIAPARKSGYTTAYRDTAAYLERLRAALPNAKAHVEHERKLDSHLYRAGNTAKERTRFLLINPTPPRHVPSKASTS